jgi:hypothetical protein
MRFTFIALGFSLLALVTLTAAADVSGNWRFVLDTPGGPREQSANFMLTGEQVSGKWNGTDVKGTFKEGKLDLRFLFSSPEAGVSADFIIKGTIKDGELTGEWRFSEWSGTFTATRVTPGQ